MAEQEGVNIPGGAALGSLGGKLGGALSSIFGEGSVAQQFLIWGVLQQIAGAVLAPVVAEIQQSVFAEVPDLVNTPGQLADMVARGLLSEGSGKNNAAKGGVGGESFDELVTAASHPPGLAELVALLQRGLIETGGAEGTQTSFDGGLIDAGYRQQWIPLLEQLAVQIPSVAEVMNAWLEGQIAEDEARTRYLAAGGDPTWFQTSYNANGQAPTPVQALELLNRGIIGQDGTGPESTDWMQAFLEGPWRNKWAPAFLALRWYLPPPRTVTAMVREGSMPNADGLDYLKKQGITDVLAAQYLTGASHAKTVTEKDLSKTDTLALYANQLIDTAQAVTLLEAVGYSATEAGYLLKLQDIKRTTQNLNNAVSRVRSQYLAGKLSASQAQASLTALGVPGDQASPLLASWSILHQANAPQISASEIASAVFYSIIPPDEGQQRLEAMGYTPRDAWIILSTRAHASVGDEPAA